ncbi:DUF3488 and transglutaminase-like domain-containing protein [Streptomyces calidiresistens]
MAIAAWVATLATSAALLPLIVGTGWLFTIALLLAVQTGTGVLARRLGFGGPAVLLCQLAVTLPALTAVTAPDHAVLGILPGPEALERLGALFASGGGDIGHYTAPAPLTEGIRLILLTGVLLIGLLVDLLAVTLRSAAAAGLPLLALYSVTSGVARDGGGIGHFLMAAAGFLVLLLTESRDRVGRWGRFFGTRGATTGETGRPPRPDAGRRIGVMTLGAAVALPLVLPALGPGLLDPARAAGSGSGGREDFGSVNPVVALQDQLNRPRNRTVLRYETTAERNADMYLRLVALDSFDGERWTSSVVPDPDPPPAPWPVEGLAPGVAAEPVSTRITTEPGYSQSSLPVPVPATLVEARGEWAHDPQSTTLVSARRGQSSANMTYRVEHWDLSPTVEQLSTAPPTADGELWERYTALPDNLPEVVREAAATVTAGAGNDYERALALQTWFTRDGGFRYNTRVESGTGNEAIAAFLEAREGFCVHFAFTMAAMSRSLEIPSRVAVGFTPGTRAANGTYSVGLHNAHAWPELYFEGVGWTRFEPTPGQGSAPEYTRPEREPGADRSEADREDPDRAEPREDPTRPEESAADPEGCDPVADPGSCQDPTAVGPGPQDAGGSPAGGAALRVGVIAVLLLAAAGVPRLLRARLRTRRLAPGAGPAAAWREVVDTARDLGIPPLPGDTPRRAAERIARLGGLEGEPAVALRRLVDDVERALYSPTAATEDDAGERARSVRSGLTAGAGRWIRLRAAVLPASTPRPHREIAARWAERGGRLRMAATQWLRRLPRPARS